MPSALDVDRKGRVVLFGTTVAPSFVTALATVQRYGPGGALDPAFNGDGMVETDFGLPKAYPVISITTGAVDAQDRPVLVGARRETIPTCEGQAVNTEVDKLVARINTDGQFDPTFGAGASLVPLQGIVEAVDLNFAQDDGPIVLGSRTSRYSCDPPTTAIVRMDAAGSPYVPYGKLGLRNIRVVDPREAKSPYEDVRPRSLALDRQGRVLVLAGPQVLSLDSTGRPYARFGKSGAATVNLAGHRSGLSSFGLDSRGRILLAGTTTLLHGADGIVRPAFTVLRLLPSGKRDSRFGRRGMTITRFGAVTKGNALSSYVDGNGRLTVAGWIDGTGVGPSGGIGLARYLGG